MEVVLLAGGFGTRISEYTDSIPKPMIEIGGRPIIWHIMNIYSHFGFNNFVVALGYKGEVIKEYFRNYYTISSDFEVDMTNGNISYLSNNKKKWKVKLVDTGEKTLTGGRLKRLEKYLKEDTFMLTYGDAVADVNILELINFHKKNKKIATVTAVHPPARFGELTIDNNFNVIEFKEKPQTKEGWINGGFFVFEPNVFNYIKDDFTILEKEPLENLAKDNQLAAYNHYKFWQSMDTVRDKNLLEEIYSSGIIPWQFQ